MWIKDDVSLCAFKFWSGGKDRADLLTMYELEDIEQQLEELYPDGMTSTQLNDLFWFDFDWVCSLIGTTEEEVFKREKDYDNV